MIGRYLPVGNLPKNSMKTPQGVFFARANQTSSVIESISKDTEKQIGKYLPGPLVQSRFVFVSLGSFEEAKFKSC